MIGETDGSPVDRSLKGELDESAAVKLLLHQFTDDAGDPESDFCKFDQKIHGSDLQNLMGGNRVLRHVFVHMSSGYIALI
mgnify:FL=1